MDQAGKIHHCIVCKDVHGYMQVLTAVSSKIQQEATNFRVLVKLSIGFCAHVFELWRQGFDTSADL